MKIDEEKLILKAREAINNAYAPYSNFKVGACILLKDGTYIMGSNVENASYGLSNCAERNAMFFAYNQGYRKEDIIAMALASFSEKFVSPCGACRQVMAELLPLDTKIYMSYGEKDIKVIVKTVKELLPFTFSFFYLNV